MPLVNYCRKCRTETPLGESCPYCGGRLPKTGEQLSFGIIRTPVTDWFSWNDVLRVALPAWLVALGAVLAAEASATGAAGVAALFQQGILWVRLGVLAGMLLALLGRLERAVDAPLITTHASITARPFFEARGYRVIREQRVERRGVRMTNFVMEKRRQDG